MDRRRKKNSALIFILKAFIPYSRENLMLSFSPNKFFNELDKTSDYQKSTLRHAYWQAKKQGFIAESNGLVKLTAKGQREIRPFVAKQLGKNAKLMVIFDIPEERAVARRKLRDTLKLWDFSQIQKSVWMSDLDYSDLLKELTSELNITACVEIYAANRLYPKTNS